MAKKKKRAAARPQILRIPFDWKDNFRASSLNVGFQLSLSRPMLEMLCAVADNVQWDRKAYGSSTVCPDCAKGTIAALQKRGLVTPKPVEEWLIEVRDGHLCPSNSKLTPPGELLVGMLKMVGMFIPADQALLTFRA